MSDYKKYAEVLLSDIKSEKGISLRKIFNIAKLCAIYSEMQ